jgi:hypothetical protein
MNNLRLDVVRADDLLALSFEFINLDFDSDETPVLPRLVRVSPGEDAFVVVHFPPQHIAERSFTKAADGTLRPVLQSGSRFPSVIAGESRLGFRLRPDVESLSISLDELLNWDNFDPVFTLEEAESEGIVHEITKPLDHETAIELPLRIMLSPDRSGRWLHPTQPAPSGGKVELWHTRLAGRPGEISPPQLWAIYSQDFDSPPIAGGLNTLPGTKNRQEIVQISSDFRLLDDSSFHNLTEDDLRQLADLRAQRSTRLSGEQLILSSLGGWMRVQSKFFFPPLDGLIGKMIGHEFDSPELFSLQDWSQIVVMGRDQYVRIIQRGYLFPFGHRVNQISVAERQFAPARDGEGKAAYVIRRSYLAIQEPERTYNTRDMPFRSIKIANLLTQDLDPQSTSANFIPTIHGAPFAFQITATDSQGATTDIGVPMVFVPATIPDLADAVEQYQRISRVDFCGQAVAFAPGPSPNTVLKTNSIDFDHADASGTPPFRPRMQEAAVHLPAAEQFLGNANGTTIAFHPGYAALPPVQEALGVDFLGDGVFATIPAGLPLKFPAASTGGVAAPNVTLDGLSSTLGAVPNVQAIASDDFDLASLEFLDGKLLGVINLKDAIAIPSAASELPRITTEATSQALQASFQWKPRLKDPLPHPLVRIASGDPELELDGSITRQLGANAGQEALSDVKGTLTNFAVSFEELVRVEFASLRLHLATHQKPEFDPDITTFEFEGDLAFINQLAKLLPTKRPRLLAAERLASGVGPSLAITPEGATASFALAIPNVGLGALSLLNLALCSQFSLFFTKAAELRFALSSREHPFLVSYSLLGGGGFFALTVSTDSEGVGLEAALEFGAVAAIDLFVASGSVQAMVGIYFSKKGEAALLEGYIRLFGSLEILHIVTISVEFYLGLSYDGRNATGTASLTVMVRVLMFSKSVTLTVTRSISTTDSILGLRAFAPAVTQDQWTEYCKAFA